MDTPSEQPVQNIPNDEYFRNLERRRTRALVEQNMEIVNRLHASDYQLITPNGKVFNRAAYLSAVADDPFYTDWSSEQIEVRKSSNTAILRYRARLQFPSGKALFCWHTDFYELRDKEWQAIWSQATAIPDATDEYIHAKSAA